MTPAKQFQQRDTAKAIATINSDGREVFYSSEFQKAAFCLISQLKTPVLRNFMIERFALNFELNVGHDFDFLKQFSKSRPARLGAFYTSESSADKILSQIEIEPGSKYLDPAVGTGNFILSLSDRMLADFSSLSLDELLNSVMVSSWITNL